MVQQGLSLLDGRAPIPGKTPLPYVVGVGDPEMFLNSTPGSAFTCEGLSTGTHRRAWKPQAEREAGPAVAGPPRRDGAQRCCCAGLSTDCFLDNYLRLLWWKRKSWA